MGKFLLLFFSCSSTCTIEAGYTCIAGSPLLPDYCYPPCGSGKSNTANPLACDDGNTVNGDGCSSTCLIEAGVTCDNTV